MELYPYISVFVKKVTLYNYFVIHKIIIFVNIA